MLGSYGNSILWRLAADRGRTLDVRFECVLLISDEETGRFKLRSCHPNEVG